ncbi:MAG: Yip1 family protein [Caryophanon sp.]|nr:Yip1 family protein [Caryophanon sp.]
MNLFTSAWIHPKMTTRYVIESKNMLFTILLFLATLLGVSLTSYHFKAQMAQTFEPLSLTQFLIVYIVVIPLALLLFLTCAAIITTWVGKLFKGTGSLKQVFQGIVVGHIPMLLPVPFMIAWLIVDVNGFLLSTSSLAANVSQLVAGLSAIWAFYITVGTVAEAHRFSYTQSIMTLLIPAALFMGFLFLVLFTLVAFMTGT